MAILEGRDILGAEYDKMDMKQMTKSCILINIKPALDIMLGNHPY